MTTTSDKIKEFSTHRVSEVPESNSMGAWHFSARDEIHVWKTNLNANEETLSRARNMLSREETDRVERLATPQLQIRQTLSFATVRFLLSRYLGEEPSTLRFTHSPTGKPYLVDAAKQIHFSVSHCDAKALYAFTLHAAVGVDIERKRPLHDLPGMLSTVLTDTERTTFESLPPARQQDVFFDAWTMKEACLKVTGEGIAGLKRIETILGIAKEEPVFGLRQKMPPEEADWFLGHFCSDTEHVAAVAVAAPCSSCHLFQQPNLFP